MYNNVGLPTARGSGTNSYVQRNSALVKNVRHHALTWDERKKREEITSKKFVHPVANKEILEHEKNRQIEAQVIEWGDSTGLLDSNKSPEEIQQLLDEKRQELIEIAAKSKYQRKDYKHLHFKSSSSESTHCYLELKREQDRKFVMAVGIRPDYKEGQAFDQQYQAQQKEKRRMQALETERLRKEEQKILSKLEALKRLSSQTSATSSNSAITHKRHISSPDSSSSSNSLTKTSRLDDRILVDTQPRTDSKNGMAYEDSEEEEGAYYSSPENKHSTRYNKDMDSITKKRQHNYDSKWSRSPSPQRHHSYPRHLISRSPSPSMSGSRFRTKSGSPPTSIKRSRFRAMSRSPSPSSDRLRMNPMSRSPSPSTEKSRFRTRSRSPSPHFTRPKMTTKTKSPSPSGKRSRNWTRSRSSSPSIEELRMKARLMSPSSQISSSKMSSRSSSPLSKRSRSRSPLPPTERYRTSRSRSPSIDKMRINARLASPSSTSRPNIEMGPRSLSPSCEDHASEISQGTTQNVTSASKNDEITASDPTLRSPQTFCPHSTNLVSPLPAERRCQSSPSEGSNPIPLPPFPTEGKKTSFVDGNNISPKTSQLSSPY